MKLLTQFIWKGNPKPLKRHRTFRNKHTGKNIRVDPSADDKNNFLAAIQQYAPETPTDKPITATIIINIERPKSHYGTGKNACIVKQSKLNAIPKGDIDNYEKFIYDAMNGVFFKDDRQIVHHVVSKRYAKHGSLEIYFAAIDNDDILSEFNIKDLLS